MALLPSSPPPASVTRSGLVSIAAQSFAGLKSFTGGVVATIPTAGASDVAAKFGTTLADGSVDGAARLLSVCTGIGGTERELLYVARPQGGGLATLTIDSQGTTNARALNMVNAGPGMNGILFNQGNVGSLQIGASLGAAHSIWSVNRGLWFYQQANAYDSSTLMAFTVEAPNGVATTVPAFDFTSGVLGTGQKLMRWNVNGSDVASMDGAGNLLTAGGIGIGSASGLYNVAHGLKYDSGGSFLSLSNANGASYVGLNLGTGLAQSSASFMTGDGKFLAAASTGASLVGQNGTGSTHVVTKLGTSTADGSVDAGAKLLSLRTGIGGTEVEKFYISKSGSPHTEYYFGSGATESSSVAQLRIGTSQISIEMLLGNVRVTNSSTQIGDDFGAIARFERNDGSTGGLIWFRGLDDSATVGASTVNKTSGINTIANGATSVRITNALVPNPATRRVRITATPHGNIGTWWVEQGSGFFDLKTASAVGADTMFSWEVNGLS